MELKRNFTAGVMNKDLDDRLVPPGQYRDALNIRVGTSDSDNVGTIQNFMGNKQKSNLKDLVNALGYSTYNGGRTIGAYNDTTNNVIYWFVTSSVVDIVAKYYEDANGVGSTYILLLDAKGSGNVLNFSENYLITGVNLVDNLLFWTDGLNPPRKINVTRNYPINTFTEKDISVIVAPPLDPPYIQMTNTANLNTTNPLSTGTNNINEKFIRFAYRYKYLDNEYSALSPFSSVAFFPSNFSYDFGTGVNVSMANRYNAVNVTVKAGTSNVKEIQVIFKDGDNLNANIIESFDVANLRANRKIDSLNNFTFTFSNNKVYAVLPEDQLVRLFDNVPLTAKAQDMIGNRIIYGNYTQFFDIKSCDGFPITMNYNLSLVSSPTTINVPATSWKSDRDYEIGIAYIDDYGRMTTVLTCGTNSITVPGDKSTSQNKIKVNISNEAPCFATGYRLFVKENKQEYYNILPTQAFVDDIYVYFLINRSDIDKVTKDSFIVIKSTPSGPTLSSEKYKVLEVEPKAANFLNNPNTHQPEGIYVKIKSTLDFGSGIYSYSITSQGTNATKDFGQQFTLGGEDTVDPINNRLNITEKPIFYGSGISSLSSMTFFNGINDMRYEIFVTATNKFSYRLFGSSSWIEQNVLINKDTRISPPFGSKKGNYLLDKVGGTNMSFIMFGQNTGYTIGDSWRVNCRTSRGKGVFGGDVYFNSYGNHDGGFAIVPGNESQDIKVKPNSIIKFKISESKGYSDQPEQIFVSSGTYENIEEWFFEERIYDKFKQLKPDGSNGGAFSIFFRRGTYSYTVVAGQTENFVNQSQDQGGVIHMFVKGYFLQHQENYASRNIVKMSFSITSPDNPIILETAPKNLSSDIFYESASTYPIITINNKKYHGVINTAIGDIAQTTSSPAQILFDSFNCWEFGNGLESYRIKDTFNNTALGNSPRANGYIENYAKANAYSALTYSSVYNSSTTTNRLNEFNLASANFKILDRSYGSIQKLYSRDNNLIVFQESKIGKVLFEKNMILDATGTQTIATLNNVLGTYIPFAGEYGISRNPESFAKWGNDIFFTDARRGVVLNLDENGISEASVNGMRDWFRDLFDATYDYQKVAAFDPYDMVYTITANDVISNPCKITLSRTSSEFLSSDAGTYFAFSIDATQSWTIQLVSGGSGTSWITLNKMSGIGPADIYATLTANGSFTDRQVFIKVTACGNDYFFTLHQKQFSTKSVGIVVVSSGSNDAGKITKAGYNWTTSGNTGVVYSNVQVLNNQLSLFDNIVQVPGNGMVPVPGETVSIISNGLYTNSQAVDLKPFNPNLGNKMYYLETATQYSANQYEDIISLGTEVSATYVSGDYTGNFVYDGTQQYLYMAIDLRNIVATEYTATSGATGTVYPETVLIDNTDQIGIFELDYNAGLGACRFVLYDPIGNVVHDTKYVGLNSLVNYNALINAGIAQEDILLQSPYNGLNNNGSGTITYTKTIQGQMKLVVYSPISGTTWSFVGHNTYLNSVSIDVSAFNNSTLACSSTPSYVTYYYNGTEAGPVAGNIIYTNSSGSSIFNGNDKWYAVNYGGSNYAYNIAADGSVISSILCSCSEPGVPVISQGDISLLPGQNVNLVISASNNPVEYTLYSSCVKYIVNGGITGGVVTGTDCNSSLAINRYVGVNESIEFCCELGSISILTGADVSFVNSGVCGDKLLPAGVTLNQTTGVLSGNANGLGQYSFYVTATNCVGTSTAKKITITVADRITYVPINIDIDSPHASASAACSISPVYTVVYNNGYTVFPMLDDIIYLDYNGATTFNGNNMWYKMDNGQSVKIDSNGNVIGLFNCGSGGTSNIDLAYGPDSASSCANTVFNGYYYTGTFGSSGFLYTDSSGTTLAPAGWYKKAMMGGLFSSYQWTGLTWGSAVDC